MTYEIAILTLTIVFATIFILVVLTNIFTQLLKKIINRANYPTQAIVFLIAEILSFIAVAVAISVFKISAVWYYWILTFIGGGVVAYGAIFGYDNLYSQLFTAIKSLIDLIFRKEG